MGVRAWGQWLEQRIKRERLHVVEKPSVAYPSLAVRDKGRGREEAVSPSETGAIGTRSVCVSGGSLCVCSDRGLE
jgi:hypothetical protein